MRCYAESFLALFQYSKDHCLCEAGDLDRLNLVAWKHLGGIAGVPDINGEGSKPLCAAQSVCCFGICAAQECQ